MELIYTMPAEVIHYNHVFEQWNEMVNEAQLMTTRNAINTVTQWWGNYAQDYKCKKIVEKYDVPRNVWKILEQYKINHTEKVYGIYYTLKIVLGDDSSLKISSVQFEATGEIDVAVIVEKFVVCNGTHCIADTAFTELSSWEDNIKVIH